MSRYRGNSGNVSLESENSHGGSCRVFELGRKSRIAGGKLIECAQNLHN